MEASIPVVKYILDNKELFTKRFIAIAAQDYETWSWAVFIAVNCERNENEKDKPCHRYLLFGPTGRRDPRDPPPRCQFFLNLEHFILSAKDDSGPPVPRVKWNASPWKDDVIAPWFINVYEFYLHFT